MGGTDYSVYTPVLWWVYKTNQPLQWKNNTTNNVQNNLVTYPNPSSPAKKRCALQDRPIAMPLSVLLLSGSTSRVSTWSRVVATGDAVRRRDFILPLLPPPPFILSCTLTSFFLPFPALLPHPTPFIPSTA